MPQFEVIRDIGSSLSALLEAEMKKQKVKGKVILSPPTREILEKQAPALSLYLYEVRENTQIADKRQWDKTVNGPDGKPTKVKMPAPLELELRWVLTAAAEKPQDEHTLLTVGMKAFHEHPTLERKELVGDHFPDNEELPLRLDKSFDLGKSATLFGALGAPHRPSAAYMIPCRVFTDIVVYPAKRVEERDITVFDKLRPPPGKPTGGGPLSPGQRRELELLKEVPGAKK